MWITWHDWLTMPNTCLCCEFVHSMPCFNIARWCVNCLSFVAFLCPDFGSRMFKMLPLQVPILYQLSKSDHSILYLLDAHPRMMIPVKWRLQDQDLLENIGDSHHISSGAFGVRVAMFDSCQRWDGGCGGYSERCNSDSGHVKRRSSLPGVSNYHLKTTVPNIPWKSENWRLEDESSSFWDGLSRWHWGGSRSPLGNPCYNQQQHLQVIYFITEMALAAEGSATLYGGAARWVPPEFLPPLVLGVCVDRFVQLGVKLLVIGWSKYQKKMEGKVELRFILCKSCIINVNYSNRHVQQDFGKKSVVGVQQKICFFVSHGVSSRFKRIRIILTKMVLPVASAAGGSYQSSKFLAKVLPTLGKCVFVVTCLFFFGFFPKQHRLPEFFWTQNDELIAALIWEVFEWN